MDDLFRDAFFQSLVDNRMDLANILKFYYDPNTGNDKLVYEWLWQYDHTRDSTMLALLDKAGVSFDRLDQ